jgi:hypothetical protein
MIRNLDTPVGSAVMKFANRKFVMLQALYVYFKAVIKFTLGCQNISPAKIKFSVTSMMSGEETEVEIQNLHERCGIILAKFSKPIFQCRFKSGGSILKSSRQSISES